MHAKVRHTSGNPSVCERLETTVAFVYRFMDHWCFELPFPFAIRRRRHIFTNIRDTSVGGRGMSYVRESGK